MFGSTFDLSAAGLGDLPADLLVPGVAVFSRRSLPLAAWTNGLEISGGVAVQRSNWFQEWFELLLFVVMVGIRKGTMLSSCNSPELVYRK